MPKLKLGPLVAKLDTGARSAALHADLIEIRGKRVTFVINDEGQSIRNTEPLLARKRVKSSNGQSEIRPVIETTLFLGGMPFVAEVTLTDRADMGVPMLLGRNTLKGRYVVNPARTFLLSRKKKTPRELP